MSLGSAALVGDVTGPRVKLGAVSINLKCMLKVHTYSIDFQVLQPCRMSRVGMLSSLRALRCLDASGHGGSHIAGLRRTKQCVSVVNKKRSGTNM